jgi:hypothetical protein
MKLQINQSKEIRVREKERTLTATIKARTNEDTELNSGKMRKSENLRGKGEESSGEMEGKLVEPRRTF